MGGRRRRTEVEKNEGGERRGMRKKERRRDREKGREVGGKGREEPNDEGECRLIEERSTSSRVRKRKIQ